MAPATAAVAPDQEGRFSIGILPHLDQLDSCFDDTHAAANAGLLLAATLARAAGHRAGRRPADRPGQPSWRGPARPQAVDPGPLAAGGWGRHRRRRPAALRTDRQRAGPPGHGPSTLGTFLRSFTFGHVRQLDRLCEQILTRAGAAGAGPGDGPITIDLDSTVCEVHGYHQQGAAYGDTRTLGDHPLLANRADTGEILHARQRTGRANTARGTAPVRRRARRTGAPP
jgi:hypothetical protein